MVFSSIIFIFFFLPIFLTGYFIVRRNHQLFFLFFSSLFFYFFGENIMIVLMLFITFISYYSSLLITGGFELKEVERLVVGGKRTRLQKLVLLFSVFLHLSILGVFKYFNFFMENLDWFFSYIKIDLQFLKGISRIGLPLGISFYIFQSLSYTIDVYRGHVKASRNWLKFATYITLFPQLVAGPIVRYSRIEKQLSDPELKLDSMVDGVQRFIVGLAKKVLIANTMGRIADQVFQTDTVMLSTAEAWVGVLAYSLQIYYDFSGYSCMAIGLGKIIGFDFPENFNYPYISKSIKEFWQRWHISLTHWFRDYLFLPLVYSLSNKLKNESYLRINTNIILYVTGTLITMFLCGLWHGAGWNFVIWGSYFGVLLSIEQIGFGKLLRKMPRIISHVYTIVFILIGWVIFRADSLSYLTRILKVMFVFTPESNYASLQYLNLENLAVFLFGVLFSTPVFPKLIKHIEISITRIRIIYDLLLNLSLMVLFLLSVINIASGSFNPFLYFRF